MTTDLAGWLEEASEPPGWTDDELLFPPGDPMYIPDAEIPLPQRFEISDDSAASWALRRLRALRQRIASNEEIAAAESARIEEWLAEANRQAQRDAQYFEAILSHYALRCRADEADGRKTVSLPAGKIATRQPAPKWSIDAEQFIPWARENAPDLLRIREEPNVQEMKAAAAVLSLIISEAGSVAMTDGEIIPGVAVSEQEPTASISIDLD